MNGQVDVLPVDVPALGAHRARPAVDPALVDEPLVVERFEPAHRAELHAPTVRLVHGVSAALTASCDSPSWSNRPPLTVRRDTEAFGSWGEVVQTTFCPARRSGREEANTLPAKAAT
jgi:hypothetical protein